MFATCPQPRAPVRRPLPRPPRNPWPAVLVLVLLIELSLLPLRRPRPAPAPAPVEGAVLVTSDHDWGNKPVRRIIPPAPQGDWARPPCADWQEEISGSCWAEMAKARPPCPGGLYEHKGRCYTPVVKGQRPPTSIRR